MPPAPTSSAPAAAAPSPAAVLRPDGLARGVPVAGFIQTTRVLAVAALLGLIAVGLAWELWLAPTGQRTLAIKVLPLVIPLAGLLKHRLYTYRWVSLMVWLYFTEGVVRAYGASGWGATMAWLQVLLCLLLFVACAAHVRWRLRHKTPEPCGTTAPPTP